MKKEASVFFNHVKVGTLSKENDKYFFRYSDKYLANDRLPAISLSLPKQEGVFESKNLFPFFYGLLSEGENKQLQCRKLKIDENDHFELLLKTASVDTIGGIRVREI